jgi:hypothetical protein
MKNTSSEYIIHYNILRFLWNLEDLNMVNCEVLLVFTVCVYVCAYYFCHYLVCWCIL